MLDRVAGLADRRGAVATIVRGGNDDSVLYAGLHGDVGVLYFAHVDEGLFSKGSIAATATR